LHCKHCYTDCFNNSVSIKKELNTKQVKHVLKKIYNSGVLWLCFTGGDPLERKDFFEIYSYAKKLGFVITLFSSGYLINRKTASFFKKNPPFIFEITVNSLDQKKYEKITQIKGSFIKMKSGIKMLMDSRIPLRIKAVLMKDNFKEFVHIGRFAKEINAYFQPTYLIYSRLNGDNSPCEYRAEPEQVLKIFNAKQVVTACGIVNKKNSQLYDCAAQSADTFFVNPYGDLFLCQLSRKPSVNLLKNDILPSLYKIKSKIKKFKISKNSYCYSCEKRDWCLKCPGIAYLETGNSSQRLPWFCTLSELLNK